MNKKLIAGLSAILLTLSVSGAAFAGHGSGYGKSGRGWGGDLETMFFFKAHKILEMKQELGLSAEQVDTIKNLKVEVKKELINSKADIEIIEVDLYSQLKNNAKDVETVNKLIDAKYDAKKNKAKVVTAAYAKLTQTLSDKQWETLKSSFGKDKLATRG